MDLNKWKEGFVTIYDSIWVDIKDDVLEFYESDTAYIVAGKRGQIYSLKKKDAQKIETYIKDKDIEFLLGVEKKKDNYIEILTEFKNGDSRLRILAAYGIDKKEQINLHAWGPESFPYVRELSDLVCKILLEKISVNEKFKKGLLSFEFGGILTYLY